MSQLERKTERAKKALDRLRLVVAVGAQLRGHAHRLRSHGLDDTAATMTRHLDDLDRAGAELHEAISQLIAVSEPGLEDTVPIGLRPPRP